MATAKKAAPPAKSSPAKKAAAKAGAPRKKAAAKRELIEPRPGDKRYIRRDDKGQITESIDVSKSLSQDVRKAAKTVAKPGQGDKGDQAKKPKKKA